MTTITKPDPSALGMMGVGVLCLVMISSLVISVARSPKEGVDFVYETYATPSSITTVVSVGSCTETKVAWDRTVWGMCAVTMSDGRVIQLRAPVAVGMKQVVCPDRSNVVKDQCVWWYGARPQVPLINPNF